MKSRRQKSLDSAIMAAGGIVMTAGRSPLIAVVQRRKDDGWVLPKGKLKPGESAIAAAQREASEETGHRVSVREYLGVTSYPSSDKPKIVQFWRMESLGKTARPPMGEIKAVKWLCLEDALARLTQPMERAFLAHVAGHSFKQGYSAEGAANPVRKPRRMRKKQEPQVKNGTGPEPVESAQPPVHVEVRAGLFRRLFLRGTSNSSARRHLSIVSGPLS